MTVNRFSKAIVPITVFVLALAAASVNAADWPQWRGPERSAISRETGLLKQWPAEGPKAAWQAPIGAGYAAVSVAVGRVFTLDQDKDGQHLVALDEATGKELWRVALGPVFKAGQYPGARSAPTVDGDLVYAFDATAVLACVKAADGAVVWKRNLMEEAGVKNLKWGFGSAPFISGDLLLINIGIPANDLTTADWVAPQQEGGSVIAFNKKTGEPVWKALNEQAAYSTPMEFKGGGVDQFVLLTRFNAVGLARKDGKLLWSQPWKFPKTNSNIATPIVDGDMIWLGSAYGVGSVVIQVDPTKTPAVREVWKSRIPQAHFCTPILLDGYLYGYDDNKLTCVEFKTGKQMWTDSTILKGQLVYADGLFYIWGERGVLGLAKLSPEKCEFVSTLKLSPGNLRWANPVVANGKLYIRDDKTLRCFDIKAQ